MLDSTSAYSQQPRANMQLKQAQASLTNTSDTAWTLDKVGSLGGATVTWQATATQGATTAGLLIVNGIFRVENKGSAGAPIGNIIVNLQTQNAQGKWVTRSTVVADGTQDDAATTAKINPKASSEQKGTFSETSASGSLVFTDATTNSAFALVPQVTIAPGNVQKLRFSATYNNAVLNLAVGTAVRAEIIVSFGNAKSGNPSVPNIDINGNGIIDGDEQWIQSINARITTTVPASQPSNQTVELIDTVQDITTTGTVTFSNPQITINFPTAIVTVNYNGGANGGTITNCAHLVGTGQASLVGDDQDNFPNIAGVNITDCDTQVIGPHTCTPGTVGCGWEAGDVITYPQAVWGDPTSAAGTLLNNQFNVVYTNGFLEAGIPGTSGFSMIFTSADAVLDYQPAVGNEGALNADLVDPTTTASGAFGGEVVAVLLNIDFSAANLLVGSSGLRFGDLTLCGFTSEPLLNGITVSAFNAMVNSALGGGSAPYSISVLHAIAAEVNGAFAGGSPSLFAQDHLFNGSCPP